MPSSSPTPHPTAPPAPPSRVSPKVTAATVAAAVATILAWGVENIAGVNVPAEIQGAITTILTFAAGWIKRDPDRANR